MKQALKDLFVYNQWANEKLISFLEKHPEIHDENIKAQMSHLLIAHDIWLCRIRDTKSQYHLFQHLPFDVFGQMNEQLNTQTIAIIEAKEDMQEEVSYTTTEGFKHQSKLKDIFLHLSNHSTHHRSQVSALIRSQNLTPPPTDYIFFTRK